MPAQLLGAWFIPEAAVIAVNGSGSSSGCPTPLSAATCYFQLTLTATTYHLYIGTQGGGAGNVVVNNNEVDFFNGALCDGVGRYQWTITGGVLVITLISDPCGRSEILTYQSWSRTH